MELFTQLGLKEVASIAGTLGVSTDVLSLQDTIEVNGKRYYYEKEGNKLTILGDGGKKFTIEIDYSSRRGKDYQDRDVVYLSHELKSKFTFPNGEGIILYNDISLNPGYEAFENVQRHNLMDGLKTTYTDETGTTIASFPLGLNKIHLLSNDTAYEFTDKGIITGNRTITVEGDKLISISGEEVPEFDELKSFDLESERAKIENFMQTTDLHSFTKEILEDAKRKLESKGRYTKKVIDYYGNDLKQVQRAVAVREKIEKGIQEGIISPEVLDAVGTHLRKKVFEIKNEDHTGYGHK